MGSIANRTIDYTIILLGMLACLIALSAPSFAQTSQASSVELTDPNASVNIGMFAYETLDPEQALTADIVVSRHKNNSRGEKIANDIIDTSEERSGRWLLIQVTNATQEKNWVINFGDLLQGRTGYITGLHIENKDRNETYINATTKQGLKNTFIGNGVPVAVTPGKTEFITIYLDHASNVRSTFVPSMTSYKHWVRNGDQSSQAYGVLSVILFVFAGMFIALAYAAGQKSYLFFAAFWVLNAGLIGLLDLALFPPLIMVAQLPLIVMSLVMVMGLISTYYFINVDNQQDSRPLILLLLSIAMVIVTFFINIPVPLLVSIQSMAYISVMLICTVGIIGVALMKDDAMGKVRYYYAASWVPYCAGIIVTGLGPMLFSAMNPWIINAYFYALVPQGLLMAFAAVEHVKKKQHEAASNISREYRIEQARREKQDAKDAEDQARLLRVIERERELMNSLREQDAQRTQEMRLAKEEADIANAAKSAFLAVVSHEIRTPMNGIMGILKLLQLTPVNEEQSDYVLTMEKTGDTMLALLNDILDFEKMETGRMELEHINVDLHNMAKGIVSLMQGYVGDKKIELKTDIAEDVPRFVLGDPTRLRQVLLNLMSNAIKFTDAGSVTIKLTAKAIDSATSDTPNDCDITFSIIDTGPGIDEAAQETLFEPFRQADETVARKYGGSGLGLAISMRLVSAMGSSIRLQSQLGEGSEFLFTLSMEEGYGEEELVQQESQGHQTQPVQKVTPPVDQPAAQQTPEFTSPLITPPVNVSAAEDLNIARNILVIEDNEINRKVVQSLLEKDGHIVTLAGSGEEGVSILSERPFDVVFVDINLPGMNGFETATEIRKIQECRYIRLPIVAITGNVMSDDLNKIKESSINDVISKPIDHEKMRKVLRDLEMLTDNSNVRLDLDAELFELETDEDEGDHTGDDDSDGLREDHYDVAVLQSLLNTLGKESLTELVEGCLAKADEIVVAMADETDVKEVHARMHELKGMAYNFGLKNLGNIARDGEDAAKEGDLKTAQKCLAMLDKTRIKTRSDIESWMES